MVPKIRRASVEAGRDETAVHVAGYLFALVDHSRREALNRAKRETFVIYMDKAIMQGATFYHEARNFYRSTGFASQGNDRAGFLDTPGDEVFHDGAQHLRLQRRPGDLVRLGHGD